MPKPVIAGSIAGLPRVAHGYFTREGGVSQGIYASLNCGLGSGDDAPAVRENRRRVSQHLGADTVITAHQIHSATAVAVQQPWADDQRPRADAIVTTARGLALGVLSADCAPILFADAEAGVVGAAHAGWRGALTGIAEATIAAMEQLGARRESIHAAVGPCIGQDAYEVGPEFEQEFLARDAANARFFRRPVPGQRPRFDLPGYVANRLVETGVRCESVAPCTFAGPDAFFSYRRSQDRKEADYGRQISAIVLT